MNDPTNSPLFGFITTAIIIVIIFSLIYSYVKNYKKKISQCDESDRGAHDVGITDITLTFVDGRKITRTFTGMLSVDGEFVWQYSSDIADCWLQNLKFIPVGDGILLPVNLVKDVKKTTKKYYERLA